MTTSWRPRVTSSLKRITPKRKFCHAPIDAKYAEMIAGAMTKPANSLIALPYAIFSSRSIAVMIAATAIVVISSTVFNETQSAMPRRTPAMNGAPARSATRASIQTAVHKLSVRYSSDFRK